MKTSIRPYVVAVAVVLTPLLLLFTKHTYADCKVDKVESHAMYEYVASSRLDVLDDIHDNVCSKVEEGELPLQAGQFIQHAFVLRWAVCRDREVNPQLAESFSDVPEPIYRVFEHYCRDKWPYSGEGGEWETKLIDSAVWLEKELLCQEMRYVAYSDSWVEVFRPRELEAVKQLEKAAISICSDLRSGKIDSREARYRWGTELQWFDDHLPKEAVQHYTKKLIKPIRALVEKLFEKY